MPAIGGSSTNNPYAIGPGVAFTGPLVGAQVILPFSHTPIASKTDFIVAAFQAPCDMRLERISWNVNTLGAASGDVLKFLTHPTAIQTSGATSLLSAASVDWDAQPIDFAAPSGETAGASAVTLSTTAGVRDIAKGAFVFCAYTTDATAVVAGTTLNILYTVVLNGYSNVNASSN
jgi:hypothetical protein